MIPLVYLTLWGILGCEITRLEAIVDVFYKTTAGQGVDGPFFAFVWSIIIREPSVYVGILPPGDHSEVYVALPPRGSRKDSGKARETADADQVASLELVEDSESQALEQLKQLYGERLRVAVNSEVLRVTLAGPHARVRRKHSAPVDTTNIFTVFNPVPDGLHGSTIHRTR